MPLPVLDSAPADVLQGDSLQYRVSSSDATPQEGATLAVRFMSPTTTLEVTGTASGSGWLVSLTPKQTRELGPGALTWVARATYVGGAVQKVASGQLTVLPLTAIGGTTISHAATMVARLEAQLEQLAADSLSEYSIGDRTAKRRAMAEVQKQLTTARAKLAAERNGGRTAWRSHSVVF